jgi:signal transduction histidine kinase
MASPQIRSNEPSLSPNAGTASSRGSVHNVQFYEGDAYLIAVVSDFLADGIEAGQGVLAIATPRHRAAIVKAMRKRGVAVEQERESGKLQLLDARKTLAAFMVGEEIDERRFRETISPLVSRKSAQSLRAPVRAYGEMVDVLWRKGNRAGAIRLEALWNELASLHDFELLCGYAMSNFALSTDAEQFEQICQHHAHVAPAESYADVSPNVRQLEISRLQQRALALENEIARRETLEHQLRDAIAEQERSLAAERVARGEAERANRAKNQFLAVMSHELRTPLNAIAGHTQLLELGIHGPITIAQRDALERIERSQRHLLTLVNDVLNLAHTESGRAEFAIEEIELLPLIESLVAMVEPLLSKAQITCTVVDLSSDVAAPPLAVRADREKSSQILLNLLTNALKFSTAGGTIAVEVTNADEGVVCVEVRDTGTGIPADKLEAVFEPFTQLETKLPTRHGGIGLGLTISRQFARGMHGDLVAASGVAQGACLRLTLPRARPLA